MLNMNKKTGREVWIWAGFVLFSMATCLWGQTESASGQASAGEAASVYNIFEENYAYPGFGEHLQDKLYQGERSFRLKLTYRF